MSDSSSPPSTRCRRPKRLPPKPNDDNVLGISWKEERELRKAMYVSLRQKNQLPSGPQLRSRRVQKHLIKSSMSARNPNGNWTRHSGPLCKDDALVRQTAQGRLRTAKLRATSKLRSVAAGIRRRTNRAARAHNNKSITSPKSKKKITGTKTEWKDQAQLKKSPPTSSITSCKRENILRVARSIVRERLNGRFSKTIRQHSLKQDSSMDTRLNKRPTLMSASNDTKITPVRFRQPLSPQRSRLRSPFKFSSDASTLRTVASGKTIDTGAPIPIHAPVSGSQVCTRILMKDDAVSNKGDHSSNGKLVPRSSRSSVSSRRTSETVPRELCENPAGQPVSVHDFMDFLCYNGSPCLDPKLQWFKRLHDDVNAQQCPASDKNLSPSEGFDTDIPLPCDDETPVKGSAVPDRVSFVRSALTKGRPSCLSPMPQPFSKGSKIYVAKKLASLHPVKRCAQAPASTAIVQSDGTVSETSFCGEKNGTKRNRCAVHSSNDALLRCQNGR